MLLLDVLDYLVDKGNMNIWSAISSKKFFQTLLDLLRTKDIPEVQMKLLGLIQKWGLNFEDKKNVLPNFFSVYNKLRANNVQFPSDFESNYQIYISDNYEKKHGGGGDNYENYEKNDDNDTSDKDDGETFYYMDSLKNVLKVPNFEHKYRRLVNFLVKMHENIQMANLLIDSREHAGLKDIIHTLRDGNNTLIDTISGGRLKDEKLMEITLGTTEDINQTLGRDEDIKNGYKPNKFKSYFVVNNVIRIKNNNHRTRAKSTKQKKTVQRNSEKYKSYDMDINYDKNKYKTKIGPKNADDIFDLFSASNPNNEPQYFQNNNNNNNSNNINSINNFFNSQTQVRSNNNNNQQGYPQLRNNPMNNLFNNPSNNNRNNNFFNNNSNNNNFQGRFNQNNNQQRPVMTNFDILEQKLNNLNFEQNQNNYNTYNNNNNNQNMQFNNQGYNNNNNNFGNNNNNFGNNNNNNNKNNNLMSMLEQLGPGPQNNSNQLVPYIGTFNSNNNQNNNMNNQNNNNQFNFNNNNNFGNNQNNNFNNNNNQYNNNGNRNNLFNSQMINSGNNMQMQTNSNMGMSMNINKINNMGQNMGNNMGQNMGNNMGNSMNNINMGNNNWMNQNNQNAQNNQQMSFEEMQKQQRLKELDDLF